MTTPIRPEELNMLSDEPTEQVKAEDLRQFDRETISSSPELEVMAGQMAAARGQTDNPDEIEKGKLELDGSEGLRRAAAEYYQQLHMQNQQFMEGIGEIAQSPEQIRPMIEQGLEESSKISQAAASPTAGERAVVQNVAPNADTEAQAKWEFELAARNDLAKMMDKQGMWETAADFGSFFLPFGYAKDISDVEGNIASNPVLAEALTTQGAEAAVTNFRLLPASRQAEVWPHLVQAVIDATNTSAFGLETDGNMTKAVALLSEFLSAAGADAIATERTTDIAFGVLDVTPFALSKAAKGVRFATGDALKVTLDHSTRRNNLVRMAAEGGNPELAASVNIRAAIDDGAARANGLSTPAARDNLLPEAAEATPFTPEQASGLAPELARQVSEFLAKAQGFTRRMTTESELLTIGALSKSEREAAVASFVKQMEGAREDLLMEGITVNNVKIDKVDSRGFEFSYDYLNTNDRVISASMVPGQKPRVRVDSANGEPVRATGRMSWKVNQSNGKYMATAESLRSAAGSTLGLSPSAWSKIGVNGQLDFGDTVKQAIQLEDVTVAAQARINELWLDANQEVSGILNTRQRSLLEEIELEGDGFINPETQQRGKVFSQLELAERGLTNEKAQRAYYKRRIVADQLHAMQNFVTRRELEMGGFGVTRVFGQDILAKMFDTPASALASIANNKAGLRILDQASGKVVTASQELIEEAYNNGARLVRSREDFNASGAGDMAQGGTRVEYILINDAKRLRSLPEQVLAYKRGYVPKIYENIEFVVRQLKKVDKPGDAQAAMRTPLRAFASRADVDKFIDEQAMSRAIKAVGDEDPDALAAAFEKFKAEYEVADGSVMSQVERMENALSSSNGLFVGTRGKGDLTLGLSGQELQRMNPTESFERYMSHMGRMLSKNEWRVGAEKRWINTVRQYQHELPGADIRGFGDSVLPDSNLGRSLDQMRDRIRAWNGVQTREESLFQMTMQRFHDWALNQGKGFGYKGEVIPWMITAKNGQPVAKLKALAMHTFLGMFNPAQLYVQASAATIALSQLSVLDATSTVRRVGHFQLLAGMGDDLEGGIKFLIQKGAIDADDAQMFRLYHRSGLDDSIRSNADMDMLTSTGGGVAWATMSKMADHGLLFYRWGEQLNRRTSFIAAATEWQNKTGRALTSVKDDDLSEILRQANTFMLELNGANRAWWQGGRGTNLMQQTLGLATQFQQVTAKTTELLFKGTSRGGFTPAQKARIITGQALLFGAAGFPLLNYGAHALDSVFDGDVPETAATLYNQGVVGTFINAMAQGVFELDENGLPIIEEQLNVAGRAALYGQLLETVKDFATSSDPLWLLALGVNAETGSRFMQAFKALTPMMGWDTRGHFQLSGADMQRGMIQLFSVPSSGRNLFRAYMMMYHDRMLDRHGRTVIEKEFEVGEIVGTVAGFKIEDELRTRLVQMSNKDREQLEREAAQEIIDMYHDWVYLHDRDEQHGEWMMKRRQMILEVLDNEVIIDNVNGIIEKRVFEEPASLKERELLKFWENTAAEELTDGLLIDFGAGAPFKERAISQPFRNLDGVNEQ